ncbi:MAG: LEA type 2 family protein [Acidobacteriota bacterium]|nr:LEA type 2 family protein [Acidobacteriota bacterium]
MSQSNVRLATALLFVLAAGAAAAAAVPAQKYDVEVAVRERIAREVSPQGVTLVFVLDLKNLTSSKRSLTRYDYRVIIGSIDYFRQEMDLEAAIPVPAKGETTVAFPVRFTYDTLYTVIPGIRGRDRIACNLVGGMVFQDERRREERVPIAFSGEFPVFLGFDAKGLPFEARSLSLGGGDLTFRGALVNPNGFPLRIESVAYKLSVGDKVLAEGTIRDAGPVEARGEKTLAVDLLLDFWEIGKDVAEAFGSLLVPIRFQGQVEAAWEWGRIVLPFDRSESVPVRKNQNQ